MRDQELLAKTGGGSRFLPRRGRSVSFPSRNAYLRGGRPRRCLGHNLGGHTREITPVGQIIGCEHKRNQRGAWLDDTVSELPGEVVAEASGSHLGNGKPAGADDQAAAGERTHTGFDEKAGRVGIGASVLLGTHSEHPDSAAEVHARFATFCFEQRHDPTCGVVAKELPQRFFVEANAVFLYKRDHVRR